MSALFNGTSSVLSTSTPPVTAYPFSVGMWVYPTAASQIAFGLSNSAAANSYFRLRVSVTNFMTISTSDATNSDNIATATAMTFSTWSYIVARFISATNRRLSIMHSTGLIEHVQATLSLTPTSINVLTLGALNISTGLTGFLAGRIGEFWYTDKDIQADGGQLNNDFLRQLAFNGPYALPHVDMTIAEYHALRSALPDQPKGDEIDYEGRFGVRTWTNTATTVSAHPSLYPNYQKPILSPRPLVMI
jgi:hypothetical protein